MEKKLYFDDMQKMFYLWLLLMAKRKPTSIAGERESFQAIRDYSTHCCEPDSVWISLNPLVL